MKSLVDLITGRGFDRYQGGLHSRFAAYRLNYKLTYLPPTDNSVMQLDFESQLHIGRVTVWESGRCNLEAIDITNGEMVFYENHELSSARDFHKVYPRLVIFMRDALGWPHNSQALLMFSYRVSDRHQLRSLEISDVDELFSLVDANRAYLRAWLPWLDSIKEPNDTQNFIRSTLQQFSENQGFVAAICYDCCIVGVISYNQIDWQNRIGYIGYWLAESHQGQGIMTASCQALVKYAFTELNLNRLVIACASENKRSRAIPERLGFKHEGTARETEWLYDHFVDHELYALLRRDAPQ